MCSKEILAQKQRLYKATNRKEIEKIVAENGVKMDFPANWKSILSRETI